MNLRVAFARDFNRQVSPTPAALGASPTELPNGHDLETDWQDSFSKTLVDQGLIEPAALERATHAAQKTGERIDRILTKLGLVSESNLAAALSSHLQLDLATPADIPTEPILTDLVDSDFLRRHRLMPLAINANVLVVGTPDPFGAEPVRALSYLVGKPVEVRIFAHADFEKAFNGLYSTTSDLRNDVAKTGEATENDIERLRDIASEAPVIRLVNQIVSAAVEARASDIHIEPVADEVLVRYRIDGILRTSMTQPPSLRAALTSRIKIMAKLDIAERRMPQDGRIKLAVRGVDVDLRVSTIPTVFGESVVIRILDRTRVELDFTKLGFEISQISIVDKLLAEPNGIILVTGPTGSGKTTTLYTALKGLNSTERKVFTVEDPIEYQIAGVNQVQVQPAIGLDFPHALRSILRQDPDIIMIGEIRDLETARIAIQSALTGHLVISTLHTNSAAAAITRLLDMGVENYLLASTVKGIVAQRLVRCLCPHCSKPARNSTHLEHELSSKGLRFHQGANLKEAAGCAACIQTGFKGRSSIAEMLVVDMEIQRLILAKTAEADIEKAARSRGMLSLYEAGTNKAWEGITTIEEVLRATRVE